MRLGTMARKDPNGRLVGPAECMASKVTARVTAELSSEAPERHLP